MVGLKCDTVHFIQYIWHKLNPDYGRIEIVLNQRKNIDAKKLNPDYGRIEIQ